MRKQGAWLSGTVRLNFHQQTTDLRLIASKFIAVRYRNNIMKPISTAKLGDHFYPVDLRFRSSADAKKPFTAGRWWGHVTADTLSNVWDHLDLSQAQPQFYQLKFGYDATGKKLIRIETGRTEDEINKAIGNGFTPIFRDVTPSPRLNKRFRILQNRNNKEIFVDKGNPNRGWKREIDDAELWEVIVPWQEYYPHHFDSPYAAYLIPPRLKVGQKVVLNDVIEDYYAGNRPAGRTGLTNRCGSLEAVWNGEDLEIDYCPSIHVAYVTY